MVGGVLLQIYIQHFRRTTPSIDEHPTSSRIVVHIPSPSLRTSVGTTARNPVVPYESHALLICLPCASETSREHTTGFHVSLTYANVCEKRYVRMAFSCVIMLLI